LKVCVAAHVHGSGVTKKRLQLSTALFWELCANGSFLEVAEVLDYLKWLDFSAVYHYPQTLARKYFRMSESISEWN
jgi:hypothetical protein